MPQLKHLIHVYQPLQAWVASQFGGLGSHACVQGHTACFSNEPSAASLRVLTLTVEVNPSPNEHLVKRVHLFCSLSQASRHATVLAQGIRPATLPNIAVLALPQPRAPSGVGSKSVTAEWQRHDRRIPSLRTFWCPQQLSFDMVVWSFSSIPCSSDRCELRGYVGSRLGSGAWFDTSFESSGKRESCGAFHPDVDGNSTRVI